MGEAGKLLILGAGVYQVPLIRAARSMGLHVAVASIPGPYPGLEIADEVVEEDTVNWSALCGYAETEGVAGVCTSGTDVCVPAIGAICDRLQLTGVSFDSAVLATNKLEMKRAFVEGGVRTARFSMVDFGSALEDVLSIGERWGYPLVLKCADSSGSRGIAIARSASDVEMGVSCVRSATKLQSFLVEEFLEGAEFGAQALVQGGEIAFTMLHADIVHEGVTSVPVGHYAPYGSEVLQAKACEQIARAVDALKLDDCALNFDFIERAGEVYVLEVGARSGATGLAEMVSVLYGIDYYRALIRLALGDAAGPFQRQEPRRCVYAELIRSERSGRVARIEREPLCLPEGTVLHHFDLDVSEGDSVRRFEVGPDRLGLIVLSAPSLPEAVEGMSMAQSSLRITLDESE